MAGNGDNKKKEKAAASHRDTLSSTCKQATGTDNGDGHQEQAIGAGNGDNKQQEKAAASHRGMLSSTYKQATGTSNGDRQLDRLATVTTHNRKRHINKHQGEAMMTGNRKT